ncbi:MAG: hypothetical protein HYY29_05075, partial [Chloroflexi bacterium]|nr:hypothetical protein [Chloroflexota bacterium]
DFDLVVSNLRDLVRLKRQYGSPYPRININFALNRRNAASAAGLLELAKDIGVDRVNVYHYYDGRNALDGDVSFYFDVESGNKLLRDLYEHAARIGLPVAPAAPPYLSDLTSAPKNRQPAQPCSAPWTAIRIKGCVEYENCHYLGVCNRILLLRMDYRKFYRNKANSFSRHVWNHPVLQFLRETANSRESNPVCRFCKHPDTRRVRCLDNVEYSYRRDRAVQDFFAEFRGKRRFHEVEGLTVLAENPYKYEPEHGC